MTWVDLSSAFAYGTKLTSTQMQNLRDNITAAFSENDVMGIESGTVSTTAAGATLTLPGGDYGYWPTIKHSDGLNSVKMFFHDATVTSTSYVSAINLYVSGGTGYAQQYYRQASPPYRVGDIEWGHFYFILRNKADKKIISSYEAEDPPWAYNGPKWNKKDSIGRIQAVPHPFVQFWGEELPSDFEIVLVDLRNIDTKQMKQDAHKNEKSFNNELKKMNPMGATIPHADFSIPEIAGFTDKIKIKR